MNRSLRLHDRTISSADQVAVISDVGAYTWGELSRSVHEAAALLADNVVVGARVALMLDSTPAFLVFMHAVHHYGGVVVPLNPSLTSFEIASAVQKLAVELVVTDRDITSPRVDVLRTVGDLGVRGDGPVNPPAPAALDETAPAMLLQTSGSSGASKGVQLTCANLAGNYDATPRWLGLSSSDTILLALPVFNTYAINQGINAAVSTGATLRLMRRFDVGTIADVLAEHRPTFIPLVPTMVARLREAGIVHDHPLTVFVGAAPSPARLAEDVWHVFPKARLLTGYGLSEATAIVTIQEVGRAGNLTPGHSTTGRPVPGVDIGIDGTPGEPGEVLVRGPGVFSSYVGSDDPVPVHDGWLKTGDLGIIDDDGRLSIVGRVRDVILRGGQNIYPVEVEHALGLHPSVLEAAVFGIADDILGEVPGAAVVLRPGQDASAQDLHDWLTERLAKFKLPVAIDVVTELPRTATGKVHRGETAAMIAAATLIA